ncbi:hypothetical protein [Halolamina sp.]|jgi:hypothetical protein|uniref:hypothetical protein n=1 Tax=Halolamina sp. TaxID=1940283 RepID=UPI000223BAB9|nr:hypothetical protein Halar_2950 [halophilic archaeon DL31]
MNQRTTAVARLVVGLLLLPAPLPPRSSQCDSATSETLDLNNSTDRETFVDRDWTTVAFSAHQVSERYSRLC